ARPAHAGVSMATSISVRYRSVCASASAVACSHVSTAISVRGILGGRTGSRGLLSNRSFSTAVGRTRRNVRYRRWTGGAKVFASSSLEPHLDLLRRNAAEAVQVDLDFACEPTGVGLPPQRSASDRGRRSPPVRTALGRIGHTALGTEPRI